MAARYIDGYFQRFDVKTPSLCLGATSLFLAIKLEENNRVRASCQFDHIVGIGQRAFTPNDIIAMEQRLVFIFRGMMKVPTVYEFIAHFLPQLETSGVSIDIGIEQLSAYYAESTLLSTCFSELKSSRIGAAVLFAALMCRDQHSYIPSTETCVQSTNSSPVTVTATKSPATSPSEPPTVELSKRIASALRWQPSLLLSPGVKPHTLWLPQLCHVTGYSASTLNEDSKRIVALLVHPDNYQQTESISYEKYSCKERLYICHLRHPIFPEGMCDAEGVAVSQAGCGLSTTRTPPPRR